MKITVYEKTEMHCSACVSQMKVYDEWADSFPSGEPVPGLVAYSAEENAEELIRMGQQQAPVWIIDYEDGTLPKVIGGNKPEELREALEDGKTNVWD